MTNLCSMCGHPDAHDPLCPNRSEHDRIVRSMDWDTELHAAGTREKTQAISAELDRSTDVIMEQSADLDALHERIAFLEAANEAGEANYQTIKALLTEVGDAKLALEAELHAERNQQRVREFVFATKWIIDALKEYDHTTEHRNITAGLNVLTMTLTDQELSAPIPPDPFSPYTTEYIAQSGADTPSEHD